jgi:hypothetical protein
MIDNSTLTQHLLHPQKLYARDEILTRPSPVLKQPGIYAWYIRNLPDIVPTADCHHHQELPLVYVGISKNLQKRLKQHLKGPTNSSTFRRTLGSLLVDELSLIPRMVGKNKFNFGRTEEKLSQWIAQNCAVVWVAHPTPREIELEILNSDLSIPLNVEGNKDHPFQFSLKALRRTLKAKAVGDRAPSPISESLKKSGSWPCRPPT